MDHTITNRQEELTSTKEMEATSIEKATKCHLNRPGGTGEHWAEGGQALF